MTGLATRLENRFHIGVEIDAGLTGRDRGCHLRGGCRIAVPRPTGGQRRRRRRDLGLRRLDGRGGFGGGRGVGIRVPARDDPGGQRQRQHHDGHAHGLMLRLPGAVAIRAYAGLFWLFTTLVAIAIIEAMSVRLAGITSVLIASSAMWPNCLTYSSATRSCIAAMPPGEFSDSPTRRNPSAVAVATARIAAAWPCAPFDCLCLVALA